MKKKIFVSSPLRGNLVINIENAKKYCHWVVNKNHIPYAPHIFFTQFLDDEIPEERDFGLNAGFEFLKVCDELWVFGSRISEGMQMEIDLANELKMPIVYYMGFE